MISCQIKFSYCFYSASASVNKYMLRVDNWNNFPRVEFSGCPPTLKLTLTLTQTPTLTGGGGGGGFSGGGGAIFLGGNCPDTAKYVQVNNKATRARSLSFVGNLRFHKISSILIKIAEQESSLFQLIHTSEILTL